MDVSKLETALQEAREREGRALNGPASKNQSDDWKEILAARDAVLQAERTLAAGKGEQHAVEIDFPVRWDTGAPMPHLLQNDRRTFLIFFLQETDRNWDGSYVKLRRLNRALAQKLAVVEFEGCICAKIGSPNDEVFHGHPLYGKGFAGYRAMAVENSSWLKELEKINSVHSNYSQGSGAT